MGLKLANLVAKEKELEIDFEGDEVKVRYNPAMFNKAFRAKLDERKDEEGSLYDAIVETIHGWNIEEEAGQMYAITRENLEALPTKLLYQIWLAILEDTADFLPKKKSGLSVAA